MRVVGASVFSGDNVFLEKDIYVKDGIITDEAAETGEVIDASDCYAIPPRRSPLPILMPAAS